MKHSLQCTSIVDPECGPCSCGATHALTREQVEAICLDCVDALHTLEQRAAIVQLSSSDAAQRCTIAQQAERITELEEARDHAATALNEYVAQQAQEIERLTLANEMLKGCVVEVDRALAAMTAERDALTEAVTSGIRHRQEYVGERITQLQSRLTVSEQEALTFYANPQTYGISGGTVERVIQDAGEKAQRALKGA